MSTLALAVEDYFKAELSTPDVATAREVAPLSSDFSYLCSSSNPDLQRVPRTESPLAVHEDTLTRVWRLEPSKSGSLSGSGASPTKNMQISSAGPERRSLDAAALLEESPLKHYQGGPLRKLKSLLKLPNLTKLYSTSQLSPKLVRFASRLENVKMFDGRDSPRAVSTQNTPTGSPQFADLDDYFGSVDFSDLGLNYDSDSDSDTFYEYTKDKQYRVSSLNFVAPQNIYDKQNSPVYLQQALLGADKKLLVLLVMCQNLAFEKSLTVKLTFNNWQSNLLFNVFSHVKSFSLVNFDQFRFVIPLSHLPSAINAQFCIRYSVNGQDHWDNNSGENYNFTLASSPAKLTKQPTTTSQPTFTTSAPFKSFSPAAQKPKSPAPYNYDELVNKLLLVSAEDERPQLRHLVSLPSLRPRFSNSYKAKQAPVTIEKPTAPSEAAKPAPQPRMADVGSFSDTKFNSTSYAALLQTYCFSGTPSASAQGLPSNLHSNSSTSLNLDFMTPASAFHSLSDSIHI